MLAAEFVRWWYGNGYRAVLLGIGRRMRRVLLLFSVPLLLRTLGAPWRRIISLSGGSIENRLQAMLDNLVSRAVGFCVRCLVLLAAGLSVVAIAVGGVVVLILWPFLPLAALALVLRGLLPW